MKFVAHLAGTNLGIEGTLDEIHQTIRHDIPEYEEIAKAPVVIIMDLKTKITVIMANGVSFIYEIREKEKTDGGGEKTDTAPDESHEGRIVPL